MKLLAAGLAAFLGVLVHPALAQSTNSPAPTESLSNLLSSGYEIKSVVVLPVDVEKLMWPSDDAVGTMIVTLQFGTSIAVCHPSGTGFTFLRDNTMTDDTICSKR